MGVTPVAELRIEAQVLVAHIVAADPGGVAIDDDDLAVVAKVELKSIASSLGGIESRHLYPGHL